MQRLVLLSLLLATSACSQRAPWTVAPAPTRTATPASAERPTSRPESKQQGQGAGEWVALSTHRTAGTPDMLGSLHFPVANHDGRGLDDSFDDPRDGGARRHHAIDIMAARGTPVLSVQDGRVLRLSTSSKGGITIYATDANERFVFYYAHLDRYQAGLREGQALAAGDTIGYVGTTGNAPEHVPHLHFQVMRMPSNGRYWSGEPINPYPFLRAALNGSPNTWR